MPLRQAAKATWAKLIRKVYEVDPLLCSECGAPMRGIALIRDTTETRGGAETRRLAI